MCVMQGGGGAAIPAVTFLGNVGYFFAMLVIFLKLFSMLLLSKLVLSFSRSLNFNLRSINLNQ